MPYIYLTQADMLQLLTVAAARYHSESLYYGARNNPATAAQHLRIATAIEMAAEHVKTTTTPDAQWTQSWHTDSMPDAVGEFPRTVPDGGLSALRRHAEGCECPDCDYVAKDEPLQLSDSMTRHVDCDCMSCRPWTS